jgi:hypothetical protein
MILTFDYPRCRKNINDRRLWSEINTSLVFEQKKHELKNTVVVITVFREKNLIHPTKTLKFNLEHTVRKRRRYFSTSELENITNIILTRFNFKFNICKFFYREKDFYGKSKIKLEFLAKREDEK